MKSSIKLIIVLILASATIYAQNGTKMLGVNAKSMGRAGTSIGNFDSAELLYSNPAGISFLEKSVIDLSASLMFPSVHFKNSLNDVDGDKNVFPMPNLAYVNKYDDSKFSWGLGVFTVGGMGADYTMKHALFVNQDGSYAPQKYHSKLAVMQGGLTAAYKLTPQLSVGLSANLVYSMLEFGMPYSLSPDLMKGEAMPGMTFGQIFAFGYGYDEVTAAADMTDLSGMAFNGKIGLAYVVNKDLSFGVTYTLPSTVTYKNGKASMDMTAQMNDAFMKAVMGYMASTGSDMATAQAYVMGQFAGMGIDLSQGAIANYDLEVELSFPQSIGFGFAYSASEAFKVSGDFEWINWANAFDKMKINLSNGANVNINKMMGNNGTFSLDFPMDWKNTVVVKLGGEYQVNPGLSLRAGYAYGSNPVPSSTIFSVFPAIVEQHVTLGGSVKLSGPLTMHAAFEMALNKAQEADANSLIGNEYNGSTSELSSMLVHLAFTYGL